MSAGTRYFDLSDDMRIPGRWVLHQADVDDRGRRVGPWQFGEGRAMNLEGKPILGVSLPGVPLDFSLTELAAPVVTQRVVALFERLGLQKEVQFVPAHVEGHVSPYFILNTLQTIRCIDEARCEEVRLWEPWHGEPEKTGQYRNVAGLKIDPTKVGSANIFRPWGWTVVLVVSERVKLAMEEEGITGARFTEV